MLYEVITAKYWLAEASYVNRDFDTALKDFARVIAEHPNSPKVPGAMLKMGYIFYEQQAWDKAREVLQRLQTGYPGSTEARLGEKRLRITSYNVCYTKLLRCFGARSPTPDQYRFKGNE